MARRATGDVRVVIVDDHRVVRQDLRSTLEADGGFRIVGEAGTAGEALQVVGETRPDVSLVDVRLPGGGGIQLIREILSRYPGMYCLTITSFSEAETAYHALMAGAAGHVAKDAGKDELVAAVRAAARGDRSIRLDLFEEATARTGATAIRQGLGSEEEGDVLDLLLLGLTNREIADDLRLSEKAVRNHVSRILSTLQVRDWDDLRAVLAEHQRSIGDRASARRRLSSSAVDRMTG